MRRQWVGAWAAVGTALTGVASLTVGAAASGQERGELFSRLDANKDGFVTADEVEEPQKGLFERLVRTSDKDEDKKLSREEFENGLREGGGPRGQGGPRGEAGQRGEGGSRGEGGPRRGGGPFGGGPGDPQFFEGMFERSDANKDGKLTKDEIPEERQGIRMILERAGGDSISKEQFVRGMLAMNQGGGQPRPDGERRPDGDRRPEGGRGSGVRGPGDRGPDGPPRRPGDGPPGRPGGPQGMGPPGGGLFAALDADRDGQISNEEIVGAGTALLKLDRNSDGRITPDEAFGPPGPPREGDRPGERRFGDRRPDGGPPIGDRRPEEGRRPGGQPGDARTGDGRPGDNRSGDARPGDGRPGGNRPGENRPGAGRGNFGPEAFFARLKEADADKDGKLSKEETPPMLRERFDQADANSDGFLDKAEMRRMTERMRGGPGPRRGGDRRPEDARPDAGDKQ